MTGSDGRPSWAARLQRERERRGWNKHEMARRLHGAAKTAYPPVKTMARQIRGWEAGKHFPRAWADAYADAFGIGVDELFGDERVMRTPRLNLNGTLTPDDEERLILAARRPSRIDTAVVDGVAATLASQRRLEDVVGSEAVIQAAAGHLRLITRLLHGARGQLADQLAATASDAAQFVGWLHTATGRHDAASPLYDQSLRLALQAEDPDLAATALSMRGHLAWVTGDFGSMAGLSQAAAEIAHALGTRTVATQQKARALALLGERQDALRTIGRAEDILADSGDRDDPDLLYFYGPEMLAVQRGLILAYLAESAAEYATAAATISSAIATLRPSVRDSEWIAWYRVQAARAWAAGGDADASTAGLRTALEIVSATGGAKTRADIEQVQRSMAARWSDHPAVADLAEALRP